MATTSQLFSSGGSWVAPAGVTAVLAECWAGGGNGSTRSTSTFGGGGGGGEYAAEATLAVTPGNSYTYTVGAGGASSTSADNGGNSTFVGDSVTVTAHGGAGVATNTTTGGAGGTGSANGTHHNGGAGATGSSKGGGGGSSAGPSAVGGAGGQSTGGTAPTGGGTGGTGSNTANAATTAGSTPGGGGGGAWRTSGTVVGGAGAVGQVKVTYQLPAVSGLASTFTASATITAVGQTYGQFTSLRVLSGADDIVIGSRVCTMPLTPNYPALSATNPWDMTGGAIFAQVTTPAIGDGTKEIDMFAGMDNAQTLLSVPMWCWLDSASESKIYAAYYDNTETQQFLGSVDVTPGTPFWWRIRESAGSILWDYATVAVPASGDWTNLATLASSTIGFTATSVYPSFNAGYYGTNSASSAVFANFNTTNVALTTTTADTVTVGTDTASRVVDRPRATADTVVVGTDVTAQVHALHKTTADTVSVSDATAQNAARPRTTADSVTVGTDTATDHKGKLVTAVDTVLVSDADAQTHALLKISSDTVTVGTDTAARTEALHKTAADTVSASDANVGTSAHPRTTSDTVSVSDAAVAHKTKLVTTADTVSVSDATARLEALGKTTADTISVSDAAARTGALHKTTSDSVTVGTDTASDMHVVPRSTADSVTVGTDTAGRAEALHKTATDTVTVGTDTATQGHTLVKTTADSVSVGDAAARAVSRARGASDSVSVTDIADVLHVAHVTTADSISVSSDSTLAVKALHKTTADTVSVSDATVRIRITHRTASDTTTVGTDTATAVTHDAPPPRPMVMVKRELPPLDLAVHIETPAGVRARWASDDAKHPDNQPDALQFGSAAPGGFTDGSCQLARDPRTPYHDLELLSDVKVRGLGGSYIAYEGRVDSLPDTGGSDTDTVTPTFVGYQASLDDDNSAAEIYIDPSLTNWTDPPLDRQAAILAAGFVVGSESAASNPDNDQPAMVLEIDGAWTAIPLAEAWYDGGLSKVGVVYFTYTPGSAVGTGLWVGNVFGTNDDAAASIIVESGNTAGGGVVNSNLVCNTRYAVLLHYYNGTNAGDDGYTYQSYWNPIVVGDHGVPINNATMLGSDIIMHALSKYNPSLNFTPGVTILPSVFGISSLAFLTPTTSSDIIKQAAGFELLEWLIFENKTAWVAPYGEYPRAKHWRARVGECGLSETGPASTRLFNGIIVQYTATDGTTRTVGPPGSNAQVTDPSLLDPDPQNPANQVLRPDGSPSHKWGLVTMGTSEQSAQYPDAVQTGATFLQAQKELDQSGEATLNGFVQDEAGIYWPAYMVRAPDTISIIDGRDTSPRRIVSTSYDDPSKVNSIQLDAPPDAMTALLERMSLSLVGFGLS